MYTNLLDWQAHELEQAKRTFGWDKTLLLFVDLYIDLFHLRLISYECHSKFFIICNITILARSCVTLHRFPAAYSLA